MDGIGTSDWLDCRQCDIIDQIQTDIMSKYIIIIMITSIKSTKWIGSLVINEFIYNQLVSILS